MARFSANRIEQLPVHIVIEDHSNVQFDEESHEIIEDLLRDIGEVDFFQCHPIKDSDNKIRATASFRDRNIAMRAATMLRSHKLEPFGVPSTLFVGRIISIKYSVDPALWKTIQHVVEPSIGEPWDEGLVTVQFY